MDPHYIRPLDVQVEAVFDPASNDFFKHGRAKRFLLQDETGTTLGRVAAFINEKKAYGFAQPTGGMGFFACIDNRDAAFLLRSEEHMAQLQSHPHLVCRLLLE